MPWDLTDNGGTNPDADFIGTTDNEPLVVRAGSTEALRVHPPSGGTAARVGVDTSDLPGAALEIARLVSIAEYEL